VTGQKLRELRRRGRWTAEYVLPRGIGRLHVFPVTMWAPRKRLARWLGRPASAVARWLSNRTLHVPDAPEDRKWCSVPASNSTTISICAWDSYIADDFPFASFPPGARVLDVGFGGAGQMRRVARAGGVAFGIDTDGALCRQAGAAGLRVCRASAEQLPFGSGSFDGVICKVVIPYTDEARAIAEIARVLMPGATARVSYHGFGYSLRSLLLDRDWKRRVYAARTIVNTLVYRIACRRLPGFWGDTIYQSAARLQACYRRNGLELIEAHPSPRFANAPVFMYHTLRRT